MGRYRYVNCVVRQINPAQLIQTCSLPERICCLPYCVRYPIFGWVLGVPPAFLSWTFFWRPRDSNPVWSGGRCATPGPLHHLILLAIDSLLIRDDIHLPADVLQADGRVVYHELDGLLLGPAEGVQARVHHQAAGPEYLCTQIGKPEQTSFYENQNSVNLRSVE